MRKARQTEDLSFEPNVAEMLADPVVQAVMARDRVSRDDVVHVLRAAQARLAPPGGVVTPFPTRGRLTPDGRAAPARVDALAIDEAPLSLSEPPSEERRPRTRWPFYVRQSGGAAPKGEE